MYDCIIIGTGAAGVSAALTLKALKRSFVLLGNPQLSAKIRSAEKIKNYPGLPCVSGEEMKRAFLAQLAQEDIAVTEGRTNGVYQTDSGFTVLCGQNSFEGRTVILATGVETLKPIAGEAEFLGRGVSYCAVCDGFLYKDKTIAVFAESEEEAGEVALLAKYAAKVYLCGHKDLGLAIENVESVKERLQRINGDMRVRSVTCGDKEIPVDGVFMLKQSVAADSLMHGLKTDNGAVAVDRAGKTSVAGVFAAGDCTGRPYQYAKAVGEGNVCAYSVNAYLNGRG